MSADDEAVLAEAGVTLIPSYDPEDSLPLLTTAGRVLVTVALHPEWRVIDIAEHLGVHRDAVQRSMTKLIGAGVLRRTKLGTRNAYEVLYAGLHEHVDVHALLLSIAVIQTQE